MKKKLITVLGGVIIALSLFVTTGNTVKAEETVITPQTEEDENCECHNVTPILGAEKNKIVADLLSSQEFKDTKLTLKSDGYSWRGAKNIEVLVHNKYGYIMIGVPFINNEGILEMAAFFDGKFLGIKPPM